MIRIGLNHLGATAEQAHIYQGIMDAISKRQYLAVYFKNDVEERLLEPYMIGESAKQEDDGNRKVLLRALKLIDVGPSEFPFKIYSVDDFTNVRIVSPDRNLRTYPHYRQEDTWFANYLERV